MAFTFSNADEPCQAAAYDLDQDAAQNAVASPSQLQQQDYPREVNLLSSEIPRGNDNFMIGLCKCGGPCCDACCCYWCQISRQYNIIFNEKQGINWGVCALLTFLDLCVLDMVGMACQCYLRTRLRRRYNMKESNCGDCCTVFWCPCCALSQAHWELAIRGDNPGATCPCGNADVANIMR